jgi:hypothetical protein
MRGDGLYGIEPDKVGELGYAYLIFYEITEKQKYLEAAIHCADVLAKHVRDIPRDLEFFSGAAIIKSPWPFRVQAKTGEVISEYTSNVVEPVKLLDELIRIKDRIDLENDKVTIYQTARDIAWDWLYSKSGHTLGVFCILYGRYGCHKGTNLVLCSHGKPYSQVCFSLCYVV